MNAVRLYGVTTSHGRSLTFAAGTEILSFRDVAAIVAGARYEAAAEPALDDYRRVVESVFRQQAVVPAPPGVVFRTREVLEQWLELHYFTLLDALSFVEDRAVARVRVVARERGESSDGDGNKEKGEGGDDDSAERALQDALRVLRRHATATLSLPGEDEHQPPTASFLVDRARWEVFVEMAREEGDRLSGFELDLTGPWPPYDFIQMQFTN